MKNKSINFIIPLVVYPFDILISLNEDLEKFNTAIRKRWPVEILDDIEKFEHPNCGGFAYLFLSENEMCGILRLPHFEKNPEGYSTLQHEIFHLAEFVLRKCGLTLNEHSHEAYAYLIGYITKEIYKRL